MKEVLLIGANGQLGTALRRVQWPAGWRLVGLARPQLDICDADAVSRIVNSRQWAAIINCAAYTQVDAAEQDPVGAWAVNALGVAALGSASAEADIPLVHISTDYVFDGSKKEGWEVFDPLGPLSVYGASKLGGELALQASGASCVIVRTSWLVSPWGSNFARTLLGKAAHQHEFRVVDDQRGAPTSALDLARALVVIACRIATEGSPSSKIIHFSNSGEASWAEVAAEVFRLSRAWGGPMARITPISSHELLSGARRPENSRLSLASAKGVYSLEPREWRFALKDVVGEILGVAAQET
ncbi:dTDP-4-dehydrorhamnose reductase [Sphingomonas sp. HF-S3]|uniref:dTDP-4-dehydrorhamnose reductase n=1 Tax=Sphingomonas rustica TaxID=3103142 RepID=A0ABV0B6M9_9SPHN